MKQIFTSVIFSFAILCSSNIWAGNDIKTDQSLLKKKSVKKHNTLLAKKLFATGGDDAFKQGKVAISAGYGFPNLGKAVLTALASDSAVGLKITGVGPLHFRAEYGLSDGVGLVLSVNYVSFGVSYTEAPYNYKFTRSSLSILGRINFHFGTTESLDPYFGVGAGYKQATWKFTSNDPNYTGDSLPGFNPFGFETTVGVRYYFAPGFGAYTELGIAKSVIQVGLVGAF